MEETFKKPNGYKNTHTSEERYLYPFTFQTIESIQRIDPEIEEEDEELVDELQTQVEDMSLEDGSCTIL